MSYLRKGINYLCCHDNNHLICCHDDHTHREDAERAKREVKKVKGRVVQIVFADKRPMKDDRKEKKMRSKVKPETELIE